MEAEIGIWGPAERPYCECGYARAIPFGCVDQGLLSVLYFLPGHAMRPHRHLDSDEYFTVIEGNAEMLVDGALVPLPQGHTFLRRRGRLHAIRNRASVPLVVQSFQTPLPRDEATVWEDAPKWGGTAVGCARCWCGQMEQGRCVNCGARCEGPLPEGPRCESGSGGFPGGAP